VEIGLFAYIHSKLIWNYYSFHCLIITFIAFIYLFKESGKQKCYQTKVKNQKDYPAIKNKDGVKIEYKHENWIFGVTFYAVAVPMVLAS
jgi:hypothetical protein